MSFEPVGKRMLYEGRIVKLEVLTLEDEGTGQRIEREICRHPGAVCVLPFLDDRTILMVRNRRWPLGGKTLLELPAGTLEKNEDPMNCAGRELQEETGFLATRLQRICDFYTSPGILSEQVHAFAAFGLERTEAHLDAGEELEAVEVGYDKALRMMRERELVDAKSMLTLLYWERFKGQGA
jgi:ADP-ribose pyrophosphatase